MSKENRKISKEYHKCYMQKCKKEQKDVDALHNEHKIFMKILNKLVDNNTITMEDFFRLVKANADKIRSDPKQTILHQPKRKMRQIIYFLVSVNDLIKETNYLHLTVC